MKKLVTVLVATIAVVLVASPAAAHVTVNPDTATQGSFARVAFRVPTESDTDSTTKLEIYLPEDAPVASVSVMPVPGWTTTVTKRQLSTPIEVHGSPVTEAVSVITWTANEGAGIKPGEFQEFPVSMGPLPKVDQMIFKALQTYSDGAIVRWIDLPRTDGTSPDNPAPVLKLVAASNGSGPSTTATLPLAGNESSNAIGWSALAVGVMALILAGFALLRTRRTE